MDIPTRIGLGSSALGHFSWLRGAVSCGIGVPKDTPAEIVAKLNAEINAGLAAAKLQARLAELGYVTFTSSPAEFGKLIARETEKWAKVIKFAGVKP